MAAAISTQPVKGTRDVYPQDMRLRQWLFGHWRAVAGAFGFEEYDACVLEHEELYVRKAGDEITGQLYNFTDKGGRQVALRPEMTPSLARMIMARGNALALPLRWFAIPQCFRYERMQKGRKREHFQWNMDIVGQPGVAAEVELMAAQVAFLRRVGVAVDGPQPAVRLRVSDRRVLHGLMTDLGISPETAAAVYIIIDKHDKIGRQATATLLGEQGLDDATAERILDLLALRGLDRLVEALGREAPGVADLTRLLELAEAAGFAHLIDIDLGVVRGLSYYTGTVWELFDAQGGMRAIAGGGRYDGLLPMLGGKAQPMVGFGFGDVVILDLLEELGLLPQLAPQVDDYIYPLEEAQFATAVALAARRRAAGRTVIVDYSTRRFKHVIRAAEEAGAACLLTIGADELARGVYRQRHLGAERQEYEQPLDL